ncbi:hypothetical protein [Flintibacter sp.]|nr:hypothetical protein [Flintibacter sp.]
MELKTLVNSGFWSLALIPVSVYFCRGQYECGMEVEASALTSRR